MTTTTTSRTTNTARRRPDSAVRLVCFPHSGAGRSAFRTWPAAIGPDIEVWTAVLPGRDARVGEPFTRDWTGLADELGAAVRETVEPPYALFGHSLGALLAFEVARNLGPAHLFVSARGGPHRPSLREVPADDAGLLATVSQVYAGGIPDVIRTDPELLGHFLPVLRADLELAAGYPHRPGPPLTCPVTAFGGASDTSVEPGGLESWAPWTTAGFTARYWPGGHFYLQQHERSVLAAVRAALLPGATTS